MFGNKNTTGFGTSTTSQAASLFSQQKPAQSTFSFTSTPQQTGTTFGAVTSQPTFAFGAPTLGFGSSNKPNTFGLSTSQGVGFNTFTSTAASTPFWSNTFSATSANTTSALFSNSLPGAQSTGMGSTEQELFFAAVSEPAIYGDERDMLMRRWNQLQAMWGFGKGFSNRGPCPFNQENVFARFKAVAYNEIPKCDDSEGFLSLVIRGPLKEVCDRKIIIQEKLFQLVNSPTISFHIEDIRSTTRSSASLVSTSANVQKPSSFQFVNMGQPQPVTQQIVPVSGIVECCDVFVRILETLPNGVVRPVSATMVANHFKISDIRSRLEMEMQVIDITAVTSPSSKEIGDYLSGPAPRGLDNEIWEKAKQQYPNSTVLIPVPVIGMNELKLRIAGQVEYSQTQLGTIKKETEMISNMKNKIGTISGKIDQIKRKQMELSNRILRILCRQEVLKKEGLCLSADEETLRSALDKLWNQLVGAGGIKSRVQELISNPKIVSGCKLQANVTYNSLSNEAIEELKEYFSERHKSLKEMMTLIREDMACLDIIEKA